MRVLNIFLLKFSKWNFFLTIVCISYSCSCNFPVFVSFLLRVFLFLFKYPLWFFMSMYFFRSLLSVSFVLFLWGKRKATQEEEKRKLWSSTNVFFFFSFQVSSVIIHRSYLVSLPLFSSTSSSWWGPWVSSGLVVSSPLLFSSLLLSSPLLSPLWSGWWWSSNLQSSSLGKPKWPAKMTKMTCQNDQNDLPKWPAKMTCLKAFICHVLSLFIQ